MKKIVSILAVVLSLLMFTLVGCSNNNEESRTALSVSNYKNWLSQNVYISDLQVTPNNVGNVTYDLSCVLNIETVKTANVEFENVTITYAFPDIEGWHSRILEISTRVGYNGESHTSFVLYSNNQIIIDFPQSYISYANIIDIKGTVISHY